MKIEQEIFNFSAQCSFKKLQMNTLQEQYLAHLRNQTSIRDMVQLYYKMGWIIDFQKLFELVSELVEKNWVQNPIILDYFNNLKLGKDLRFKKYDIKEKSQVNYSLSTLKNLPFFRSLNSQLTDFLLKSANIYQFAPQSLICKTGDSSRDLYVLLNGEAAIYKQKQKFMQFISILPESSVFGEAGFFLGEKRTADIIAIKKSDILVVPYQQEIFDRFIKKEKAFQLQHRFWIQHALLHSELFKKFPSDCLDALTFSGQVIELKEKQLLFKQGDLSHAAYIVIQGSLGVMQNGVKINILEQGSFLGEISLIISGGRRTASVYGERNTLLLEIHKDQFYNLLSENIYLAKEIQLLALKRIQNDQMRLKKCG